MEIRRLAPEEYDVLRGIGDVEFCPDAETSVAIVAQDGDEIVARAFLVSPTHLEGSWIREDRRGGTLAKRMMDRVEQEAKAMGLKKLLVYAMSEQHEMYLQRLGFSNLPLTLWIKEL